MYIDELNNRHSTYNLTNKNNNQQAAKPAILSQKSFSIPRRLKLRWLLGLSCIPLFGIYTAFGLAPKPNTSTIITNSIVEHIPLPDANAMQSHTNQTFAFSDRVRSNDTVNQVLSRLQVKDKQAIHFFKKHALPLSSSQNLRSGQTLYASVDEAGHLAELNYHYANDEDVQITKSQDNNFVVKQVHLPAENRLVLKSGTISHSLFASTDAADIPNAIALQLIKIFESEIDFHREIQKGDRFNVIYQAGFHNGTLIKSGQILAVEFINKHKKHIAIGHPDKKGKMQYYSPNGKSLGKTFLRSPLEFTRITSGFSRGRYHPILQRIRAHKGVDMAAPTGTKIRAAGDATVSFSGWKRGYGRVVMLKHAQGVKTVYGHLSKFAKHLKKGKVVKQGQVIGYVGQSGMATGPHLHYEFLKNGRHLDPMKVALPKNTRISAANKTQFLHASRKRLSQLKLLENTNIAALQ